MSHRFRTVDDVMSSPFPTAVVLRALRHEAAVHAVPGRELRDLGDSLLLRDLEDPEPFWNRLEAIRFPDDVDAFDRRLAEVGVLFASIGRQPHLWLLPPHDTPGDLYERLVANGFEDAGPGHTMIAAGGDEARVALRAATTTGVRIERHREVTVDADARSVATTIVNVLSGAFIVDEARRPGVIVEVLASLADPRFTHYVVRADDEPVAVARRATFDGLTYLSSIGTIPSQRGRGFGRLVTATATADGFDEGSELAHLGVFADNGSAISMYQHLGYAFAGGPGPDMILIG
jgi:ribosomal protein S18 acetylase RimI-like enzyme